MGPSFFTAVWRRLFSVVTGVRVTSAEVLIRLSLHASLASLISAGFLRFFKIIHYTVYAVLRYNRII